jgi:hypothetical protein
MGTGINEISLKLKSRTILVEEEKAMSTLRSLVKDKTIG